MRKAALLLGSALALTTAACNSGGGGDAGAIEETPNGVTQIPPPGTDMNAVAASIADEPNPTDAANYAAKAGMSDLYEVEAGKIAQAKAQNAALKAFGGQMVEDHRATSKDLTRAIADAGLNLTPPTELDARHRGLIDALNAASGPAFDTVYRDQQMAAHQEALALHQNYAANGDTPHLKAVASAVAPRVERHLGMLRDMK